MKRALHFIAINGIRPWLVAATALLLPAAHVRGVIFHSTGDPAYNTNAPAGNLADSGWQFQGLWGGFLGTPIAPKYFITAGHVGGVIGQAFVFNGVPYATTAVFDDPDSDLAIWRICGTFPTYAPLYANNNEAGRSIVVIGRGTQRSAAVILTNLLNNELKGWQWGTYDGVLRWGENQVEGIVNGDGVLGSGGIGEVLQATFDLNGGSNECHLSVGDSAGAVFIKEGATWKLAGINFAVDGPYNTTDSGDGFSAAIFDQGGLYQRQGTNWVLTPDLPFDQPGSFYATRISSNLDWINSVLSSTAPGDSAPTLQSATNVAGPYADFTGALVNDLTRTITLAPSAQPEFYRLRSCSSLRISAIQFQGGNLIMSYE